MLTYVCIATSENKSAGGTVKLTVMLMAHCAVLAVTKPKNDRSQGAAFSSEETLASINDGMNNELIHHGHTLLGSCISSATVSIGSFHSDERAALHRADAIRVRSSSSSSSRRQQ